jgi:hypothetical protein
MTVYSHWKPRQPNTHFHRACILFSQEGQERVEGVGDPVEGVLADFLFRPGGLLRPNC